MATIDYKSLYGVAVVRGETYSQAKPPMKRVRSGFVPSYLQEALPDQWREGMANSVRTVDPSWPCMYCSTRGYVLVCARCRVACHGEWGHSTP